MNIDSNWVLLIPVVLIVAGIVQFVALFWLVRLAIRGVRRFRHRPAA